MDMVLIDKLIAEKVAAVHKQYNFCDKCKPDGGTFGGCIRCALIKLNHLVYELDRAMASPEDIERDTRATGDWVSGLDLIYTAEDVFRRAIARIQQ